MRMWKQVTKTQWRGRIWLRKEFAYLNRPNTCLITELWQFSMNQKNERFSTDKKRCILSKMPNRKHARCKYKQLFRCLNFLRAKVFNIPSQQINEIDSIKLWTDHWKSIWAHCHNHSNQSPPKRARFQRALKTSFQINLSPSWYLFFNQIRTQHSGLDSIGLWTDHPKSI